MRKLSLAYLTATMLILLAFVPTSVFAHARVATVGPGVCNIPQGTQSNTAFANSFTTKKVTNMVVTSQQTSCFKQYVMIATYIYPTHVNTVISGVPGSPIAYFTLVPNPT